VHEKRLKHVRSRTVGAWRHPDGIHLQMPKICPSCGAEMRYDLGADPVMDSCWPCPIDGSKWESTMDGSNLVPFGTIHHEPVGHPIQND
jgi:hypothetical protein